MRLRILFKAEIRSEYNLGMISKFFKHQKAKRRKIYVHFTPPNGPLPLPLPLRSSPLLSSLPLLSLTKNCFSICLENFITIYYHVYDASLTPSLFGGEKKN